MKRDLDLIRLLLLEVESGERPEAMSRYSEEQVLFHCRLAIEAGFLEGEVIRHADDRTAAAILENLTWEGHGFLEAARSDTNWNKVKARILKAGGSCTFEMVKSLLVETAKRSLP